MAATLNQPFEATATRHGMVSGHGDWTVVAVVHRQPEAGLGAGAPRRYTFGSQPGW